MVGVSRVLLVHLLVYHGGISEAFSASVSYVNKMVAVQKSYVQLKCCHSQ